MKRALFHLSILFSICIEANAQFEPAAYSSASGVNSVTVFEATTPEQYDYTLMGKAPLQTKQTTQYLDGLGRVIQTVAKQASPSGNDVVSPVYYDNLGRTPYGFLPFVSTQTAGGSEATNDGQFKLNPFQQQKAFYQGQLSGQNETYYYSQVEFDGSPLNRITKSFQSGNSWVGSDKYSSINYDFNQSDENVHIWNLASNTSNPTTSSTQVYGTGKLSKLTTTDEEGKKTITYTDLSGNTILKKVQEKDPADLTIEHSGWACTYYVYDDRNQLRFMIPSKAVEYLDNPSNNWNLTSDVVNDLCFKYEYDERGRVIVKKQPGTGQLNMVYDAKDRVVFMQDGNMNKSINTSLNTSKWIFKLYDEYDRVIATGLVDNDLDRQTLQDRVTNDLSISDMVTISAFVGNGTYQSLIVNCPVAGYASSDNILSNSNIVYNSITHYDSYNYQGVMPFNSSYTLAYTPPAQNTETLRQTNKTLGFVTGEKVRIIDNDNDNSNDQFIFSTTYYDNKGRNIQTLKTNIKGGADYKTNQFDFAGNVVSSYTSHYNSADTYTIVSRNEYDKDGRLIDLYKNFNNNGYNHVTEYAYDELGRLKQKRLSPDYTGNGGTELESLNYSFNIHNQITGINKDYALKTGDYSQWDHFFGMYLGFDNKDNVFSNSKLNGQVTGIMWNSQGDDAQRKYNYAYDNAGRLINADFTEQKTLGAGWSNSELDFSVSGYTGKITYDLNGNLLSMTHKGVLPGITPFIIDDLRYSYADNSNKLVGVTDRMTTQDKNGSLGDFKDGTNDFNDVTNGTAPDYVYDNNGNVVIDLNKNIKDLNPSVNPNGIHYNFLDKPDQIHIAGKGTIKIVYSADGEKLQRIFTPESGTGTTTTYINQFVYQSSGNSGDQLSYINFEEGRVRVITPTSQNDGYDLLTVDGNVNLTNGKKGVFDYYILDYQQNVRMIVSEETHVASSTATMETSRSATEDAVFGQPGTNNEVETTKYLTSYTGWTGNSSSYVSRLGNLAGHNIGPNTLQKVMAGDVVIAKVNYYFNEAPGSQNNSVLSAVVNSLTFALTSGPTTSLVKGSVSNITNELNTDGGLFNVVNPSSGLTPGAPLAFLNVVFFDERFKYVGFERRQVESSVGTDGLPLTISGVKSPKNGYAFVYVSNKSDGSVYFDDLAVTIAQGNIIEENHYYAFGLRIAAISSKKLADNYDGKINNPFQYNGKEMLDDDADLNWYDYGFRSYDPQIGRFMQLDPLAAYFPFLTPYQYASNDPITNIDLDGLEGIAAPSTGISITVSTIVPKIRSVTAMSSPISQIEVNQMMRQYIYQNLRGQTFVEEISISPFFGEQSSQMPNSQTVLGEEWTLTGTNTYSYVNYKEPGATMQIGTEPIMTNSQTFWMNVKITRPVEYDMINSTWVGLKTFGSGLFGYNKTDVKTLTGDETTFKDRYMGGVSAVGMLTLPVGSAANVESEVVSEGSNIVGTEFDEVLPTQDWINPEKVSEYKTMLQSGQKLTPINAYRQGGRVFIEDGHHRFAAYMEMGMKPDMIIRNTGGPIGYPNWLNTSFQTPPIGY